MFRLQVAGTVIGILLIFFGVQEYRVSSGTTSDPQAVNLADVENQKRPANNHWQLGEHIAVYPAAVYSYSKSKFSSGDPTDETHINYCYYPVLSHDHPFPKAINALVDKYSGKIPDDTPMPEIGTFAVLVKTKRFGTIGNIPRELERSDGVAGMVVNQVSSLGTDEARLVRESFPSIDLSKVVILQEGRRPSPLILSFGLMLGGAILSLGSLGWMALGWRKSQERVSTNASQRGS